MDHDTFGVAMFTTKIFVLPVYLARERQSA